MQADVRKLGSVDYARTRCAGLVQGFRSELAHIEQTLHTALARPLQSFAASCVVEAESEAQTHLMDDSPQIAPDSPMPTLRAGRAKNKLMSTARGRLSEARKAQAETREILRREVATHSAMADNQRAATARDVGIYLVSFSRSYHRHAGLFSLHATDLGDLWLQTLAELDAAQLQIPAASIPLRQYVLARVDAGDTA